MNVLVVGGAGYIGSHAVRVLESAGHETWIYDNLITGHRESVRQDRLIEGELSDQDHIEQVLGDYGIDAVMHFAAFALVGESVSDPARYYGNNVAATLSLLDAMRRCNLKKLVFSSTTATYGEPKESPISEETPQAPINPYGFTKLVVERAMSDYSRAYGLGYAALRYFNAAGATPDGEIGEDHDPETHLIPLVLRVALGQRNGITIFGDDHATPDGTCVRDYVHVDDLAQAHLLALEHVTPGNGLCLNLGTGQGSSVRQIIEACRNVTGHDIPAEVGPRRPGDPPMLIADASRAEKVLKWSPQYTDVEDIIRTAWRWHSRHPHGFGSEALDNLSEQATP